MTKFKALWGEVFKIYFFSIQVWGNSKIMICCLYYREGEYCSMSYIIFRDWTLVFLRIFLILGITLTKPDTNNIMWLENSVTPWPRRESGFLESCSGCRGRRQTSEAHSEMPREIVIQKWMGCEQKCTIYMWSQEIFQNNICY